MGRRHTLTDGDSRDAELPPDSGHSRGADRNTGGRAPNASPRRWFGDLLFGARLALAGGREGWIRTALTAVGVGLGVAVLLLAAAVPNMVQSYDERDNARKGSSSTDSEAGDGTVLSLQTDSQFQGERVRGRVLQPGGDPAQAPVPPGLHGELPGPGEVVVSPALQDRLDSADGDLLAERIPGEISGTIGYDGLTSTAELVYYAGSDTLDPDQPSVLVVDYYGFLNTWDDMGAVLLLLVVVVCAVLLFPVGVFIATAVRLGGQRRDERLAALRLVGADTTMTRRIAAGEALFGALLGLVVGAGLFAAARPLFATVQLGTMGFQPADVSPHPLITGLVVLVIPAIAVLVTLMAMRRITAEPLGVTRAAATRRRRLWWRLLLPALGLVLLVPLIGNLEQTDGDIATWRIAAGIVLLLIGVTAVLPWLVEQVVARLRGGPVSMQLATRRLQQDSGPPSRAISGITVAVAGAIAVQMFLHGIDDRFVMSRGMEDRASDVGTQHTLTGADMPESYLAALAGVDGVTDSWGTIQLPVSERNESNRGRLVTGGCDALADYGDTTLEGCRDGDSYLLNPRNEEYGRGLDWHPGMELDLNPAAHEDYHSWSGPHPADHQPMPWTVPDELPEVERTIGDRAIASETQLLVTPGALPDGLAEVIADRQDVSVHAEALLDPGDPLAIERVRNLVYADAPAAWVIDYSEELVDDQFAAIERGLYGGAIAVLLLTAASLIVSTLEQLRERRRLLSVLVAYGTPRGVLARSVLWQTLLPVAAGIGVAVIGGIGLGAILQALGNTEFAVHWPAVLGFGAIGAGVILLATLLSMPTLWRMMRPAGLRSE